jgi:hypothetical protein
MIKSCRVQLLHIIIATIGAEVLRDAEAKQSTVTLPSVAMSNLINDAPLLPSSANNLPQQGHRNAQGDLAGAFDDVNATFDDFCYRSMDDVEQIYYGTRYYCRCDANSSSVICSSPFPAIFWLAPYLTLPPYMTLSASTTAFYNASSSNRTANVTSQIPTLSGLQICFEYQYMDPSSQQSEALPRGCLEGKATGVGKRAVVESCSATLTAPNGTLETCASCLPCSNSGLSVQVDCSNVNELAGSKCYPLDGAQENVMFLDLIESFGKLPSHSGASSIGTKLGWGLLLLQASVLMRRFL